MKIFTTLQRSSSRWARIDWGLSADHRCGALVGSFLFDLLQIGSSRRQGWGRRRASARSNRGGSRPMPSSISTVASARGRLLDLVEGRLELVAKLLEVGDLGLEPVSNDHEQQISAPRSTPPAFWPASGKTLRAQHDQRQQENDDDLATLEHLLRVMGGVWWSCCAAAAPADRRLFGPRFERSSRPDPTGQIGWPRAEVGRQSNRLTNQKGWRS